MSEPVAESDAADSSARTIRDFDFTGVEWREQVSQRYLTPVAEPTTTNPVTGPVVTVGKAAYVDVDADGDEDALVPLVVQDDNSLSTIYYIWTWDPAAVTAAQVENPIARTHRCGPLVDEVVPAPDENAFLITERLRRPGSEGACADEPTLEVERAVTLSDGWPVLATALGGHGGICPQPRGHDDTWPVEGITLLAGPRPSIGAIEDAQLSWFAEADLSGHPWLYREGWLLVNFGPFVGSGQGSHFQDYGDYTPCAWIEIDPSRQSEFGVLPPAEGE
ncbi:hypothetical protein [Nocardioides humi]|uniref:DUF946 domain-containing protein n=1 Tax=Nocardioides humi TaxID=449461 RepID=A0ABN2AL33_9ACTN|nr:hypothetical protein [Nocardioides humi]